MVLRQRLGVVIHPNVLLYLRVDVQSRKQANVNDVIAIRVVIAECRRVTAHDLVLRTRLSTPSSAYVEQFDSAHA